VSAASSSASLAADESIAQAFGCFVLSPRGFLASDEPDATEGMRTAARVLTSSPALRARQREILDRYTSALAAFVAAVSAEPSSAPARRSFATEPRRPRWLGANTRTCFSVRLANGGPSEVAFSWC
jgi:hypothetical protein